MDQKTQTVDPVVTQMMNLQKYGGSGGKDMRGIITDIKAGELPDECSDEFSNAPFEFNDSARSLWDDTQILYYHATTENRFSENYLKLCERLESNIRRLGSVCLTKAVLEQKGMLFPDLADLNILELVKMVSFHMRKSHAAFRGVYYDNGFLGMTYLNWEFRWFDLGSRLKATEVKIDKIRTGKINADSILYQEGKFRGYPRTNDGPDKGVPQSLRLNPTALPLDRSIARVMLEEEKEEEKQAEKARRQKEKRLRALTRGFRSRIKIFEPAPIPVKAAVPEKESEPEPDIPRNDEKPEAEEVQPQEGILEGEARRILIEDAMKRGDQASLMAIPREDTIEVHARWMRYLKRVESGPPLQKGISSETRKNLRAKRKKKKK